MFVKHSFRFLKHGSYWACRLIVWLGLFVGLVWALAVLLMRYFLLPNVDEYREPIVLSVSEAIGQTVEIGRIEGDWRDFWPELQLFGVRVHEPGGLQTLALDRVDTVLSWKTLIAGKIVFKLIEFTGSNVEIRRDSLGTLWLAGKAVERREPESRSRALSWLLAQQQIVVDGARVTWIDEMRSAPVLEVRDVKLRIENSGQRHSFELTGKPPAEVASAVTVSGQFSGSDFENLSGRGRLYAEFEYADLAYAQKWFALPVELDSGLGVMRLWIDIEDRAIQRVIAEGDLVNVTGRLGADLDTFALASVSGNIQWDDDATGESIAISDLAFEAVDGIRLSPASITIKTSRTGEVARQVRIRSLELAPLVGLSRFLPVSADTRTKIASLQPGGVIDDLTANWLEGNDGVRALRVNGRFSRLALKPFNKMPGFSGMSGSVSLADGGGKVALKTEGAVLDYPQLFAEPIPFDYLDADAKWQSDEERFRVSVETLSFTNEHAAGKASGSYYYPGKGRGDIDLRAVLVRGEAQHVWRYFPNRIENTRTWLRQGLVSGVSDNVKLHFAGSLDKFPFKTRQDGIFELNASVRDAAIRIGEDWPLIEGVNGDFSLNGDRIDITPRNGTIVGADVSRSRVSILDLGTRDARLSVDGKASGRIEQYLKFVASSPVATYTKGATAGMRGQGIGDLELQLDLPFFRRADIAVKGNLDMAGPAFSVDSRAPGLSDYAVRVEFDKNSFALRDGRAEMLGGPIRFNSVASRKGTRMLYLGGVAEAEALSAFLDLGTLSRLDGRAEWNGSLSFDKSGSHLRVESTLVGVGSGLPAPLDKLTTVALPMQVDLWTTGGGRSEYAVRLNKVGSARMAIRQGKPERGEIVFGGDAVLPQRNEIVARGELGFLDFDGWREAIAGSRSPDSPPVAASVDVLDLRFGKLRFAGRVFDDLRVSGKQVKNTWQIGLSGRQANGNMVIASDAEGAQRINARFSSLALAPDTPAISVPVPSQQRRSARRIPAAFNVIVEALQFEGKPLGRLELLAEPSNDGWRLERLAISNPDGRINVKGEWRIASRPHAEYTVRIEALDNGAFLKRLGYAETVVGGTGSLTGPVSWLGGPFHPDLPTLSGKLKLEAADGRFAQVDPGAAQLIGILSLQALPRRITLNFKDVFSAGFSFDRIEADVTVTEGVARTNDFRMDGVAAEVTMKGEVNLVAETQDLEVHVRPMLTSAAAVAGAAVVNPLVGVAALLVQKALGDPVEQAASRDYRVTGTWGNPQVARIERQSAKPAGGPPGR